MKCKNVRKNLYVYIQNELNDSEKIAVQRHLDICELCSKELKLLRSSLDLIDKLPQIEPSEGFEARFWEKVEEFEKKKERVSIFPDLSFLWNRRWVPAYVTALFILVAVGSFLLRQGKQFPILNYQEMEISENLDMYVNYELIENLDLLEDYDLIIDL